MPQFTVPLLIFLCQLILDFFSNHQFIVFFFIKWLSWEHILKQWLIEFQSSLSSVSQNFSLPAFQEMKSSMFFFSFELRRACRSIVGALSYPLAYKNLIAVSSSSSARLNGYSNTHCRYGNIWWHLENVQCTAWMNIKLFYKHILVDCNDLYLIVYFQYQFCTTVRKSCFLNVSDRWFCDWMNSFK